MHLRKKHSMLSQKDSYRLMRWLDEHKEDAVATTDGRLAQRLSKDLGMTVTLSNIGNARRALGLGKQEKTGLKGPRDFSKRHETARDVRFGLMTKALEHIYTTLGEQSPHMVALKHLQDQAERKTNGKDE